MAASFDGAFLSVNDLTYGSGRYVAIGYDREEGLPGQPIMGRVWLSTDGTTWNLLPRDDVFARAYLTDVVTGSDGNYLIFGRIIDVSGSFDEVPLAIWESSDGRSWHRTDLGLPGDLTAVQVAVGQKGYLLSGIRDGYELWLSQDARSWDLVQALDEHSVRVAAGTEGFVVTGFKESAYVVTASGNGREWFEATNAPKRSAVHAASLGGDWILASGTPDNRGVAIWFSANGLDWNKAATLAESGEFNEVVSVLNAGDRVYVCLARLGDHPALFPAGVWSSSDGTSWRRTHLGAEVFVVGAASSGETVVLAGPTTFFVRSASEP